MKNKIIQEIAEKTNMNDHTGALITLARAMGCDGHVKTLGALKAIHHNIGYMPHHLMRFRYDISRELHDIAKRENDPETYFKIMEAF